MSALGFSSCQSVHTSGVCIHTAVANSIALHLALDPEINPLTTSLCFSTFAPPTNLAPTASCAVSKHNKEGLSADITNTSACSDDVLDCDVAHQSNVSAHLFPSFSIYLRVTGSQLFHTTLTLGHFSSSVCVYVCVWVCVCVCVYVLCFMFYVLYFMFYVLCFMFYVLC